MFAGLVQRELEATANESVAKKEFQDAEQRAQDALDAMTQTALMRCGNGEAAAHAVTLALGQNPAIPSADATLTHRYNEEQLWSDKMRALSTYVSAGLVGINTLLLMVSVLVIEPYKRSRLTEQVVQRLEKELNASGGAVELLRQTHDRVTLLSQPCSLSREKEEEVQQDIGARTGREDSGIRLADGSSASVEADKEGRRFVEARDLLTVEGWKALLSMVRDSSQREKSYAVAGAFIGGAAAALLVGFMNR